MFFEGIFSEKDLHDFLRKNGFNTNHKKHENENGYDVIALKAGYSFLIEFKLLNLRDNGMYRFTGDISGDILIVSSPSGRSFVLLNDGMSLTKAARFIDMI